MQNNMTNKEREIEQKKEELMSLKGSSEAEKRRLRKALQEKIREMESDLTVARNEQNELEAKFHTAQNEKESQQMHLRQLKEQLNQNKETKTPTADSDLSWSMFNIVNHTIWGPPKCELVESVDRYEILGKLGKNRKTSRVHKAVKDKKTHVAVKRFSYDENVLFPSWLSSAKNFVTMSAADRVNHEKKSQELRDNLIRSVFREPMLLYEMRKCPYINSLDHIVSPAQVCCSRSIIFVLTIYSAVCFMQSYST